MATSWGQLKTPRKREMATEQSDPEAAEAWLLLETSPFLRINQMKRSRHGRKSVSQSRSAAHHKQHYVLRTSLVSMSGENSLAKAAAAANPLNPQI